MSERPLFIAPDPEPEPQPVPQPDPVAHVANDAGYGR